MFRPSQKTIAAGISAPLSLLLGACTEIPLIEEAEPSLSESTADSSLPHSTTGTTGPSNLTISTTHASTDTTTSAGESSTSSTSSVSTTEGTAAGEASSGTSTDADESDDTTETENTSESSPTEESTDDGSSDTGSEDTEETGQDLDCEPGDMRECGEDKGICTKGKQFCNQDRLWEPCDGIAPEEETCDDERTDEDCDGEINEDCEWSLTFCEKATEEDVHRFIGNLGDGTPALVSEPSAKERCTALKSCLLAEGVAAVEVSSAEASFEPHCSKPDDQVDEFCCEEAETEISEFTRFGESVGDNPLSRACSDLGNAFSKKLEAPFLEAISEAQSAALLYSQAYITAKPIFESVGTTVAACNSEVWDQNCEEPSDAESHKYFGDPLTGANPTQDKVSPREWCIVKKSCEKTLEVAQGLVEEKAESINDWQGDEGHSGDVARQCANMANDMLSPAADIVGHIMPPTTPNFHNACGEMMHALRLKNPERFTDALADTPTLSMSLHDEMSKITDFTSNIEGWLDRCLYSAQCPSSCAEGYVCVEDTCQMDKMYNWIRIPGGQFGGIEIQDFWMNRTEVTVSQYRSCVLAGACTQPGSWEHCNWGEIDRDDHPINCLDWDESEAYCAWTHARIPNYRELQWAARGRERGLTYPWGNTPSPSCDRLIMNSDDDEFGCGEQKTWAVGSKPLGASRDGLMDLAGNLSEWTSTKFDGNPGRRVAHGGSLFNTGEHPFKSTSIIGLPAPNELENTRRSDTGFRCARDVP